MIFACAFCLQNNSIAQDYTQYYELIDSADHCVNMSDFNSANEYYLKALSKYKGFGLDYERAIINNYDATQKLDYELIKKGFKDGLLKRDLVYTLERNGIPYSKKGMKKIYRKNKLKKKKGSLPVYSALIRDQRSRSKKNGNMAKADSITTLKLKKWMIKKPHLFNRFETSFFGSEMIGILMIHSGWKNLESVQDTLYNLTRKGWIHRSIFASIIERQSLYGGYIFELDFISNKIIGKLDLEAQPCNQTYNSTIYTGYGGKLNKEKQAYLLPPNSPLQTEKSLNKIRKHFFYGNLEILYSNPLFLKVSREEYCGFEGIRVK